MTAEPAQTLKPNPTAQEAWECDFAFCRTIVKRFIEELHGSLDTPDFPDAITDSRARLLTEYEKIFGAKASPAEAMVSMTTLLLKLHGFNRESPEETPAASAPEAFGPEDVSILTQFLTQPYAG